jgi:choline dehydrogenase-like flavoprotein
VHVVVVGAGSAGCAVAGRLAERGVTVSLIESGPDWRSESCPDEIRRPSDDVFAWRVDGRAPSAYAAPGVFAHRLARSAAEPYLRGWGMGGTSSLNGLVTVRPPEDEFAHWVDLGCEGWAWADVLPIFTRLEDDVDYGSAAYHGHGGPVPVVRREESEWGSGDRLLAEAAFAAGHAWEPDYHRPGALGVSRTASNIRLGVRVTAYDGYVERWRSEGRIRVHSGTTASRVVMSQGRASGVEVSRDDGTVAVVEGDHVVLAGGAASTPGLLQRSGIGHGALLAGLGIPLVADLPVGEGVQDHVGFWLQLPHKGARPAATGARGNATLRYSSDLEHSRPGDLLIVAANPAHAEADEVAFGVKLAHCLSRGSSRIVSTDPRVGSEIRMNLLEDPRDRVLARAAVRSAVGMLSPFTHAVRDRFGHPVDADLPDDDLDSWLRACARDTSHLTGGACMGGTEQVVDSHLRVRGVDSLTVADLSVCPIVPRANTYLTAVMIGERAADFVAA